MGANLYKDELQVTGGASLDGLLLRAIEFLSQSSSQALWQEAIKAGADALVWGRPWIQEVLEDFWWQRMCSTKDLSSGETEPIRTPIPWY